MAKGRERLFTCPQVVAGAVVGDDLARGRVGETSGEEEEEEHKDSSGARRTRGPLGQQHERECLF